jgi:hypothetical protein
VDSFLRVFFLFEVTNLKNAGNMTDNISRRKDGHLKRKVPRRSAAASAYNFLVL